MWETPSSDKVLTSDEGFSVGRPPLRIPLRAHARVAPIEPLGPERYLRQSKPQTLSYGPTRLRGRFARLGGFQASRKACPPYARRFIFTLISHPLARATSSRAASAASNSSSGTSASCCHFEDWSRETPMSDNVVADDVFDGRPRSARSISPRSRPALRSARSRISHARRSAPVRFYGLPRFVT